MRKGESRTSCALRTCTHIIQRYIHTVQELSHDEEVKEVEARGRRKSYIAGYYANQKALRMREEELEISLKVVIVGNGAVGKSSMIQRFCKGTYTRDYKKTIGVDFLEREIEIDGEDVRLMLWDTAGQEEFDAITAAYYRGAHACVLAFSATDRDSFDAIPSWKLKVENECGEIPTVLVQNKMDLVDQCVIDPDEAERLSRALGCKLLRTSVKEDVGVTSVFRHLSTRCLYEMRRYEEEEEFRLYPSSPRSASVISAFSPNGSVGNRNLSNGTIVLRATGKMRHHKKKNFVKNACLLL